MKWLECFKSDGYNLMEFHTKTEMDMYCQGKRFGLWGQGETGKGKCFYADYDPIFVADTEKAVRDYHRRMSRCKTQIGIDDLAI